MNCAKSKNFEVLLSLVIAGTNMSTKVSCGNRRNLNFGDGQKIFVKFALFFGKKFMSPSQLLKETCNYNNLKCWVVLFNAKELPGPFVFSEERNLPWKFWKWQNGVKLSYCMWFEGHNFCPKALNRLKFDVNVFFELQGTTFALKISLEDVIYKE